MNKIILRLLIVIRRWREKKAVVALLVFFKKLLFDAKGPFGANVIKNPASNTNS